MPSLFDAEQLRAFLPPAVPAQARWRAHLFAHRPGQVLRRCAVGVCRGCRSAVRWSLPPFSLYLCSQLIERSRAAAVFRRCTCYRLARGEEQARSMS